MDDVVNRLARELADAIAAAVADDPQVEACREKARAAGFEMRVTLEAVVGFLSRTNANTVAKVTTPTRAVARRSFDITANDRRFLRSLRIAAEETKEEVVTLLSRILFLRILRSTPVMSGLSVGQAPPVPYARRILRARLDSQQQLYFATRNRFGSRRSWPAEPVSTAWSTSSFLRFLLTCERRCT